MDKNLQEAERTPMHLANEDRVRRILQEAIDKFKISMLLPRLFKDPTQLREHLPAENYKECVQLMKRIVYANENNCDVTQENNVDLIILIELLQKNVQLNDDLLKRVHRLDSQDATILEALYLLKDVAGQRTRKFAVVELKKEKEIRIIYNDNENIKKAIADVQRKMHHSKIHMRWKRLDKHGAMQKYEQVLAFMKWDNEMLIREETAKSRRRIQKIQAGTVAKQKYLQAELELTKSSNEKLTGERMQRDRDLRAEKNKYLLQLQSLIRKYDQNIADKVKENMELKVEYEKLKEVYDEVMIEYHQEGAIYEKVVIEKEEEDERQRDAKVMVFMRKRAARIIQRFFRRYLRRIGKAPKKSAKKGTNKKPGKK